MRREGLGMFGLLLQSSLRSVSGQGCVCAEVVLHHADAIEQLYARFQGRRFKGALYAVSASSLSLPG